MAQAGVPPVDASAAVPLSVEVRSIDYIPRSERHGTAWHLGAIWFVGNAELVSFATGPIGISLGLNFAWTAVAIVLGTLLGTLFMAFHSAQGPKLGLSQMIQSRAQFGYYGALLPIIAVLFVTIGYGSSTPCWAARCSTPPSGPAPRPPTCCSWSWPCC